MSDIIALNLLFFPFLSQTATHARKKQKMHLTFQIPNAKPPKFRAIKTNLGARRSTLLSLYGSKTARKTKWIDDQINELHDIKMHMPIVMRTYLIPTHSKSMVVAGTDFNMES